MDTDSPMAKLRALSEPVDEPASGDSNYYCYPGGHATFSSTVFLSLYEEEEAFEQPMWSEAYSPTTPVDMAEASKRPTIYHLLRLFDSIRGFHKGYLDLSGRHAERYYNLQSQWNRYLCSFLSLETEITSSEGLNDSDGMSQYHIAFNAERWRRFQLKWRLPESASYGQLLKCTQKVLRELKQNPVPTFQTLCLVDLPVEVLDHIVSLASTSQAKAFACTCHTLNDIGQRHIFRTWRMKLHVPPHVSPFNVEYSAVDLPALAWYSRQDLEKSAQFLIDTPHVSQRIQRLVLNDEWWVSRRAHPHDNNPFVLGTDFYKTVTQSFTSALKVTPRLSTLVLCNLDMNLELARRISEIPTLHTLELHLCHIPRSVSRKLSSDSAFICPQVSNLRIYMDSSFQETHSQWYSLLFCPNVRTLSVVQFGIGAFPTPDAAFWKKCKLDYLERLSLDNIDSADLAELVGFLTSDTTAAALITHFKLHMDWGIPDVEVISLLNALRNAPMEVLVLEGMAEAEFELFDSIVGLFPDLLALTIVRRQNGSQHQNKLALWPHASWEYARCLRGFRKLKHFCWNFWTEYWDATPAALLAFEVDFGHQKEGKMTVQQKQQRTQMQGQAQAQTQRDGTTVQRRGGRWRAQALAQKRQTALSVNTNKTSRQSHTASTSTSTTDTTSTPDISLDDVPYFLDSHWMALPFAAHCPTLTSFSLMDRTVDMVCRISRDNKHHTGAKVLTPKYYPTHQSFSSVALGGAGGAGAGAWNEAEEQEWNTATSSHWPRLLPIVRTGMGARSGGE